MDRTVPNQYMERHRITQGTGVEDFMYKLHDCVTFSKLDMKQGYHQAPTGPRIKKNWHFQHPMGKPKTKLFVVDDLFFQANRIIIPTSLHCVTPEHACTNYGEAESFMKFVK